MASQTGKRKPESALRKALMDCYISLQRVGCQFFACAGPDKPYEEYCTCFRCKSIQDARSVLMATKRKRVTNANNN